MSNNALASKNITFTALVGRETRDGEFKKSIEQRSVSDLPDNDLLIEVYDL